MQRFQHRVRRWPFVNDRTHLKNPTLFHAGYNMDEFPQLKYVNSQQAEQINQSLKSLSTVLAHYRWETSRKVLELYFVRRNICITNYKTGGLFLFCCYLYSFVKKNLLPTILLPNPQKNLNTTTTSQKSPSTPILPTQLPPPLPLTYAELYDMSVLFSPELAI